MQYRNLPGTELRPSAIGFGCASVMGTMGAGRSRRALETALEEGINYFDVARSYGFGAAEGLLGKFFRGRRDQVILTSKFGILPPKRNGIRDRLRPLIRPAFKLLGRISPKAQQSVRQRAGGLTSQGNFTLANAQQSLEQSLRELQTDHLDIWLLHDCMAEIAGEDELFAYLDSAVGAGKVRYYGVASNQEAAVAVLRARPAARVVQFSNSAADDAIHRFENLASAASAAAIVTHSPFGRGSLGRNLSEFLGKDGELARRWSGLLDLDLLSPAGVSEFLLRFAIVSNQNGIVICSMFDPVHIRANAAVADRANAVGAVEQVAAEMRGHQAFDPPPASDKVG